MSEENLRNKFIFPSHESPDFATREKWAIIALPVKECKELTQISSANINDFADLLRKQYEENIEEIKSYLGEINKEIEIDIRLKSSVLKDDLNILLQSVKNKIENLASFRTEILFFEEIKFDNSVIFCQNLFTEGITLIDHFYDELKQLEKYRSDKFKVILKQAYEKMEKCSYKLPQEIQIFFENQILHINQMLLTNLRNYKDLHTNLKLVFINDMKVEKYNIIQFQDEWKSLCIDFMFKRLQNFNVSDEEMNDFFEKHKDKTVTELILLFREYEAQLERDAIMDEKENQWIHDTHHVLDDIDEAAKQLLDIYDSVDIHFKDPSNTIIVTFKHDRLFSMECLNYQHTSEPKCSQDHSESNLVINSESDTDFILPEQLEALWKNTLKNIIKFVHQKYMFIRELKEILTNHNNRIEELNTALRTDIAQNVLKNDRALMEKQEMTLNIALDTLRQEANEKNMIKKKKKLLTLLNKMQQTMENNKEAELKVVDKYSEFVDSETELYLTTLNKFVAKYGLDEDEPIPVIKNELGIKNLTLFGRLKNTTAIEDIIYSQSNIMLHLRTQLEMYPEKCVEITKQWMQEHTKLIESKFENKLSFHQMRNKRIELEVYNVRLAELKKHEERLSSHTHGIEKALADLDKKMQEFQIEQETNISSFINKVIAFVDECYSCKTSVAAELYVKEYQKLMFNKNNDFTETVKNFTEQVLQEINQILTSNYDFLKHIKLFCEGGNYNPKEVNVASKILSLQDNVLQKKCLILKASLNQFQKKTNKFIDVHSKLCRKRLTEITDTLVFKETLETSIDKIQCDIKDHVYKMKYSKKIIDTINEKIKELAEVNNFSNVYAVMKYVTELINHCKEHQEYLEETDTPSKIYNVLNITLPSEPATPKSKKSKTSKTESKKSKKEVCVFETYNLFDFVNTEEVYKWMPIICKLLQEMFCDIENIAKIYYGKQYDVDNVDIPKSYNEFMIAIMRKCKYYYLQCVQAWALAIQEFAETTKSIFYFVNEYCSNYLQYTHDTHMQILKNKQTKFYQQVKNEENTNLNNIKNVQNQLKPLHGYPGNRQLLDDLKNKMLNVMNIGKENFYTVTFPFEEFLENCKSEYKANMDIVSSQIEEFKNISLKEDICHNMINQVKNVISNINVEDFDITLENIVYFIIENTETNLDAMIGNIEEELRMQNLENECKLNVNQIESTKREFYDKISYSYKTWISDIERVLALYTIKYE